MVLSGILIFKNPIQMQKTISMFILTAIFAGCEERQNSKTVEFAQLAESTFTLTINRVAQNPEVQYPADSLKESDYTATDEEINYEITFSEGGQNILIESLGNDSVSGERINSGETSKRYELNEGLFAGGRFLIWIINGHFGAEYTVYGSGVPIIRSERGILSSDE
jgi:hypothetical protein